MVALVDHQDPLASLGEVLGAHAGAAARADYHHVGFDLGRWGARRLLRSGGWGWSWGGWKLDELVRVARRGVPALGRRGESGERQESWVGRAEDDLAQGGELPVKPADLIQVAVGPFVEDLGAVL